MATPSSLETDNWLPTSPSVQFPLQRTDSDPDVRHTHSPRTPSTASVDVPLLTDSQPRTSRSHSLSALSPLNPSAVPRSSTPPSPFVGPRGHLRQSIILNRVACEESQALASQRSSLASNRASMILYRLAGEEEQRVSSHSGLNHQSVLFNSADSTYTVSYDSKYPSGAHTRHKLIPYPFDPALHIDTPEDDDALHDPSVDAPFNASSGIPIRGLLNVGVLVFVIVALLCLFIFYPVWHYSVEGDSTVP